MKLKIILTEPMKEGLYKNPNIPVANIKDADFMLSRITLEEARKKYPCGYCNGGGCEHCDYFGIK